MRRAVLCLLIAVVAVDIGLTVWAAALSSCPFVVQIGAVRWSCVERTK